MTVGIYDPYLHILGGAERYILSIAQCHKNANLTVFGEEKYLKLAAIKFGIPTAHIKCVAWPKDRNKRRQILSQFDLFYYVTDGSIFLTNAKKNILIIQSPSHIPQHILLNRVKLLSWQRIICYSQYMAKIIGGRLQKKAMPLFVPVANTPGTEVKKENIILSVGRFFPHLHNKKQLEMISIFKELYSEGLKDTTFYLVGSIDPGAQGLFDTINQAAQGFPIKLITNATYEELLELYRKAKIYWHATGFGEDLLLNPERAEHFGVSTIEAMQQASVPVVFAGGGQVEIVNNGENGFTWLKKEELKKYTRELIKNESLRLRMAVKAQTSAGLYNKHAFCEELHEILENK